MKTLCVIPVFNEDSRLINLINQMKTNDYKKYGLKYIFVNNGSTDNSLKIIKNSNYKFLDLKKNMGVGYALILGYLFAQKHGYDYIVHLAGNGKMNPADIDKFMKSIVDENYDFISGSRFLESSTRKNNPIHRLILIKLFGIFINFLLKKKNHRFNMWI